MVKLGIALAIGFLAGGAAVMLLVSLRANDLELATVLPEPVDELAGQQEPKVRASTRTLAAIMRTPSDFEQTALLYQLLRDADAATIRRLLAEADELRPAREGHAAKSIIVARYAELDPVAAVQAVMADGGDPVLVRSVFAAWAKMDHEAALESARDLPELTGRHAAVAVLTVADALSDGERRNIAQAFSVLSAFQQQQARVQARNDPAAAWRDALATHGAQAQGDAAEVLWQIAHRWADTDPQAALAAVLALPSSGRQRTWLDNLAGHWAQNDLDAATAWALAQPWSAERIRMLASIARVIAGDSPGTSNCRWCSRPGPGTTLSRPWLGSRRTSRLRAPLRPSREATRIGTPARHWIGSCRSHVECNSGRFGRSSRFGHGTRLMMPCGPSRASRRTTSALAAKARSLPRGARPTPTRRCAGWPACAMPSGANNWPPRS